MTKTIGISSVQERAVIKEGEGKKVDILYFDGQRRLVSVQRDVPPCSLGDQCPPYPSEAPARYVLELNAGEATRLKLEPGAELQFGPGVTQK